MRVIKTKNIQKERLSLKFRGKKYAFSIKSLILFPIGTFILASLMIQFFSIRENNWLHEIIAKHSVFLMNFLFNVEAEALYLPEYYFPWHIDIPGSIRTYINNGCTYITSMSIFTAIFIFTPPSQDPKTRGNIVWRKTVNIITSLILIYIFNIFRIATQNYLYHLGYPWSIVHDSLLTYTIIVIVHILIFMFCNIKTPEIFISIYYSGNLIYQELRKHNIAKNFPNLKKNRQKIRYAEEKNLYERKPVSLNIIIIDGFDSRLIQFLKENKHKYTAKAIKNRLFNQQDKVTVDFLEKKLQILLNAKKVLSESFNGRNYYFILRNE
ncbi:MAG: hypothetical protein ACFE9S_16075 [Candidatus Hermodarchaeota archaeon]